MNFLLAEPIFVVTLFSIWINLVHSRWLLVEIVRMPNKVVKYLNGLDLPGRSQLDQSDKIHMSETSKRFNRLCKGEKTRTLLCKLKGNSVFVHCRQRFYSLHWSVEIHEFVNAFNSARIRLGCFVWGIGTGGTVSCNLLLCRHCIAVQSILHCTRLFIYVIYWYRS